MEVLRTLKSEGVDVTLVQSLIPANFTFPVYKNALRCILYYCYQFVCQKTSSGRITVSVQEENGKMSLIISGTVDVLKELQQQLTGTPSSVFNKEDIDRFFGIQLMLCFVQSALEQLHTVVRYVESDSGQHSLMLIFDPATLIENQSSEKKTIL